MTTVTWDFVPNQTVWVITDSGIETGVVNRAEVVATGAGETVSYYIKLAGDSVETKFAEADVYATCQAAEGYQAVNYGGGVASASVAWTDTGSPLTSLTASVTIDTVNVIALSISGASMTFQQVVDTLNSQVGTFGTVAIVGGNIRITSATTGAASNVAIADTDLFSSLAGFVVVDDAIVGLGAGAVEAYAASLC